DALDVWRQPPPAGCPGRGDRGDGPAWLDVSAPGLPEGAAPRVHGCESRHPGIRLPAAPGANRSWFRRFRRQGSDEWDPDAGRVPAGPGDGLRIRDPGRGARVYRWG